MSIERGKAGGHEPPLFPLQYHILAFFSSGSNEPLKCDFKKSSRVTLKSTTQTIASILLKINILCVEFFNCFTKKVLTNLTEYCMLKYHKYHNLEISQSLMIIQILTHFTKSILKSLINQ